MRPRSSSRGRNTSVSVTVTKNLQLQLSSEYFDLWIAFLSHHIQGYKLLKWSILLDHAVLIGETLTMC